MKIRKMDFISHLEAVMAGTTYREETQQSSCVVFREGWIVTYNDEIACLVRVNHEFDGAVPAVPLLRTLRRMRGDKLEIVQKKGALLIQSGKNQSAKIKLEAEITLPMTLFDKIVKDAHVWKPLSKEIVDAMQLGHACASNDASERRSVCVHFHPKYVEATDNHQAGRYLTKTGLSQSVMIEKLTVGQLIKFKPDRVATNSKAWIYFMNEQDDIMACRRVAEEPLQLGSYFEQEGEVTLLPSGLSDSIDAAAEMTAESDDNDMILIAVKKNELVVKGEGKHGWYRERIKTKYKGRELSFYIAPGVLRNLNKHHKKCKISQKFIIAKTEKLHFVSCLSKGQNDD